MSTLCHTLYFDAPYTVAIRSAPQPELPADAVRVATTLSAVSAGTELLFYRGQIPPDLPIDATLPDLQANFAYPLSYGYACVGLVVQVGAAIDPAWRGRRVFAFHPHTSTFVADPAHLLPIPDEITDEQAVLLPNVETAVNFVQDARPLLGERALIFGQGVVGLLTLRLLARFPLCEIAVVDEFAQRLAVAQRWGATATYTPTQLAQATLNPDLILELSSNPAALDGAVQIAGLGTRILVGSWYGTKRATLTLGGTFHRNRIQIISSQVSTIAAPLTDRWDKNRRMQLAWAMLRAIPVADLITHRLPITAAPEAYQLLDQHAATTLQLLFTYPPPPNIQ
jgi:2-desacetyl-2-hydroxyethyl bacteriochlorophyllide A dehydrogenase